MAGLYMVGGTGWTLAGVFSQHILGWVTVLVVLAWLDVATYGALVFLLSWLSIPATLISQGLPTAATRFISRENTQGQHGVARELLTEMKGLLALGALFVGVVAVALHTALPADIASRMPRELAGVLCLGVLFLEPLLRLNQFAALGLKDPSLRACIGFLLPAALRLGLVAALLPLAPDARGIVCAYVIAWGLAYLASEGLLARRGFAPRPPRLARWRTIYRFSIPLVGSELLALGVMQADKIFVGYLSGAEAVGTYGVASRLAFLAIAPAWAAAQTFAPVISEHWATGRIDALRGAYQRVAEASLLITGIAVAAVLVNTGWMLRVCFPELNAETAQTVVQILSVGLLLTVLPGNQAQLYRMSGRTGLAAWNAGAVAVLNLCLNGLLVPRFGALGAAWATATSLALGNLSGFVFLKLSYGFRIHPFGERYWVSLASALGLIAVAFVCSGRPALGNLAIAGIAIGAVLGVYGRDLAALSRGWRRAT